MAAKLNWRAIAAQTIYRAYPDSDLLPIDPPKVGEPIDEFAVRAETAADTLFLFLCREANDDIDVEEYLSDCIAHSGISRPCTMPSPISSSVPHPSAFRRGLATIIKPQSRCGSAR